MAREHDVYDPSTEPKTQQPNKPYDPSKNEQPQTTNTDTEAIAPSGEHGTAEAVVPEAVAGWQLTTDETDFFAWTGDGGRPPAGFVVGETTATVAALSHGGRYANRWTTRVTYSGPERDGDPQRVTKTIASYTLTSSRRDRGFAKNRARAIAAAIEWMETHPSQPMTTHPDSQHEEPNASSADGQSVEFGRLDAANKWRDTHESSLGPSDTRRTMTVTLADDIPGDIVVDAETNALASREAERKTYGQTTLSGDEKRYLKRTHDTWTWGKNGFEAMAAKAALQAEGASDWLNYYEPGEGATGSLATMERGKDQQARTGAPTAIKSDYDDTDPDIANQANQAARAIGETCTHAQEWCEQGDDAACEYLLMECDWTEHDVAQLAETVEAFEHEMDDLLTDDGGRIEPGETLTAPAIPETGELPGFAKGTLKRAWTGYRTAIKKATKDQDAAERFEDHRVEAERYAQIVNEVREHFGQEPMSFDRLGDLNAVSPVALSDAPTNDENTTGFKAAVTWSHQTIHEIMGEAPYDPIDDTAEPVDAAAETSDLERAKALHATRKDQAQTMDESIQAREQVTDFETWAYAPNMMDFIGVDDLESVLGIPE